MSKTAAKRQAHRESVMYRIPGEGWEVLGADFVLVSRQTFQDARRALAAWRAERVRELMGMILPCTCGGQERNRDVHRDHCPLFQDPSRAAWHAKCV